MVPSAPPSAGARLAPPARPSRRVRRAVVLGGGVSGVTTAHLLARHGFAVTLVAAAFGRHTTSVLAPALWEWPRIGTGRDERPPDGVPSREAAWAVESYQRFLRLAHDPATGVTLRRATFYLDTPLVENPDEHRRTLRMRARVAEFRHDPSLVRRNGVDPGSGMVDAYGHLTPVIDTDVYLAWLTRRLVDDGASVRQRFVRADEVAALAAEFAADVVVNCTGLGAQELAGDAAVVPARGAWFVVRNGGPGTEPVREAHCAVLREPAGEAASVTVVPRGDRLVLGGSASAGSADPSALHPVLERCGRFLPALGSVRLRRETEFRIGLRPFRRGGARVERVDGPVPVVHNYGHGAAGVALSWGAAVAATRLARAAVPR
jgi:D-amino-acid oxidase